MEERLKKQRNRLLLRIILMMAAVWLTVSAVFCGIRLYMEKANVQKDELASLSQAKQLLTVSNGDLEAVNQVFLENSDFADDGSGMKNRFDAQFVITDRTTGETIADTAGTIAVRYALRLDDDATHHVTGLLELDAIRSALGSAQLRQIADYLNTVRADNSRYELICTKFRLGAVAIVPVELRMVLVDSSDARFLADDCVAVYELKPNVAADEEIYNCSAISRNTVPKDFLLNGAYNRDLIGALTAKQRKAPTDLIPAGGLNYLFYAKEYLHYDNADAGDADDEWLLEYARQVNLFDNCRADLLFGTAIIFCFFLTVAVLLCVMVWRTVREQLVQEQKRLDLTNALAHDIKTPLFVISGYAYSLKEHLDEAERELYLDNIIEQTDEVNSLVQRMLSFSKLDSYRMTLNKTAFDLSGLTAEILKNYRALPDSKRIAFTHSGSSTVTADRELIKTALQNLIDNAAKYALPGSEIQIDVAGGAFTIRNQAEPMTKDELKQLWEPYVRKDKSRRQKGNGLGLSIVKSILELHHARVQMEMKEQTLRILVILK